MVLSLCTTFVQGKTTICQMRNNTINYVFSTSTQGRYIASIKRSMFLYYKIMFIRFFLNAFGWHSEYIVESVLKRLIRGSWNSKLNGMRLTRIAMLIKCSNFRNFECLALPKILPILFLCVCVFHKDFKVLKDFQCINLKYYWLSAKKN